jgi:hypothetical protein
VLGKIGYMQQDDKSIGFTVLENILFQEKVDINFIYFLITRVNRKIDLIGKTGCILKQLCSYSVKNFNKKLV